MRLLLIGMLFSLPIFSLEGCRNILNEPKQTAATGIITINLIKARPNLHITKFVIAGASPGKAVFYESNIQKSTLIRRLSPGTWDIAVDGLNSKGRVIARGYSSVIIKKGISKTAPIKIRKLTGNGKLELDTNFPPSNYGSKIRIEGSLWQIGKKPITFYYNPKRNKTTYSRTIRAGYYDLLINQVQNRKRVGGAMATVKIINGGRTKILINMKSQTPLNFSTVVTPKIITDHYVTIRGERKFTYGSSINVFAEHKMPGEVVISWYLDGRYIHNGDIFNADNKLVPGIHRLDVSVFTLNGKLGASASSVIQVSNLDPKVPGSMYKLISYESFSKKRSVKL